MVSGTAVGTIPSFGQRIAHDAIIDLGIERTVIERGSRAAMRALLESVAEAQGNVSLAVVVGILQRHEETAGR
jgi:hypothetical protein